MEKFLELNSEQNHDDYCLAYVFTDRDFDDGVLGLAWVGAPSGKHMKICFIVYKIISLDVMLVIGAGHKTKCMILKGIFVIHNILMLYRFT